MPLTVTTGVTERAQESSFMNATLQDFSDTHAISIAVSLPDGFMAGVDPDDEQAVRTRLLALLQPALDAGAEIEVQVGPNRDEEERLLFDAEDEAAEGAA